VPEKQSALACSEQSKTDRQTQRRSIKQEDNTTKPSVPPYSISKKEERREEPPSTAIARKRLYQPNLPTETKLLHTPVQANHHTSTGFAAFALKAWHVGSDLSSTGSDPEQQMSRHDVGSLQGIWKGSRSSSMLVGLAELVRRQRLGSDLASEMLDA
jgi:hypothetical protein